MFNTLSLLLGSTISWMDYIPALQKTKVKRFLGSTNIGGYCLAILLFFSHHPMQNSFPLLNSLISILYCCFLALKLRLSRVCITILLPKYFQFNMYTLTYYIINWMFIVYLFSVWVCPFFCCNPNFIGGI